MARGLPAEFSFARSGMPKSAEWQRFEKSNAKLIGKV
jgi:hypothetical protein